MTHTSAAATAESPILTSVIASRLKAVGERMGVVIERSAHSPLLVEGRDFSLGIYDHDGRLLEQTEYIPVLGYATAPGLQAIANYFKGDVKEGDVVLHNDTISGGNQLADWKVAKPVFCDGKHFAWVVVVAHQADVGGGVAGSYNPNATDVWQEALRIPPVKVYDGGLLRRDVWDFLFCNVRLSVVADDVRAMIGACNIGEQELKTLVGRYGLATFSRVLEKLLDSTESMARRVIAEIPDGVYRAEAFAYDDAIDPEREMVIRVAITVEADHMTFDFAGTAPQTGGYVNAPVPVTLSAVMIAFFMLAGRDIPHNDAIMRCIDVVVPEGTMLNPHFPAATGFGNHLSDQVCAAIMLALASALPEQVTAGWNPLLATIVSGWNSRTNRPYVDIFANACKGGSGGTHGADGFDHIGLIAAGGALAAQDPEMFEIGPVVLHKYEYLEDSAGVGEWRGGLGVETIVEFTESGIQASVFGDGVRADAVARGILGGSDGCANLIELTYPDGRVYRPRAKELVRAIPKGTKYRQVAGGGGGYGDPRKRPASRIADEVRYGYVSPQVARDGYGVVVDPATGRLDEEETLRLRNSTPMSDRSRGGATA
jgi:N-methylhydantoinase B